MIQVSTRTLKEMVSKAIKGCSNNKMLPMTSIMAVQLKEGELTLITTDMTNYLYVSDEVAGEDFYATVKADMFARLILSITSETISFEMAEKFLEIHGNGVYKVDLVLDETGSMVEFPEFNPVGTSIGEVSMATVRSVLDTLKPALSKDVVTPCYTNYFVGDSVIATDLNVINSMDTKLFNTDSPLFISSELMDLIGLCTGDTVDVRNEGDLLDIVSDHVQIHSTLYDYVSQYQTEDINAVIAYDYPSKCEVNRNALLQTLDRIALFLDDEFADGVVNMIFGGDGLTIESTLSNGTETLAYVTSDHTDDFTCMVDVQSLREQIKSFAVENLTIYYGREESIKLVDGDVLSCIGLVSE